MAGETGVKKARPEPGCPCKSGQAYAVCCGAFIDHDALPATAEQLMRSRYTAYVLAREDYLLHTWHGSTRPAQLGLQDAGPVKWLGLKVLRCEKGGADDRDGIVEFVARYQVNGRAERLHEASRFVRDAGQWLYVDGQIAPA
ncbi:MAG TPA: YchJ family metal-binding protein [Acidiferrobacterales bacterium]|nr:YchJ family metal-binding protein [Acidiferrobacterales bacterium]